MEDGGGGADHGAGGGGDMRLLLSILADGEEQARRLVGDPPDDDGGGGGADHGGGGGGGDMRMLLSILADGEEQATRLVGDPPDDDGGRAEECCCRERAAVARQLRRALGKAVAVAKAIEAAGGGGGSRGNDHYSDSPRSADESSGATLARVDVGVCKRRKGLPRWTQKFRMPDASLEYTPEDGFSWRKYGQKDILGAKFPRAYYRCTYRSAQGCPATRQVQRSDADVAVFDVTYQGDHACHQKQQRQRQGAASPHAVAHGDDDRQMLPPDRDMKLLASFKNGLKVETDGGVMAAASVPSFHGLQASPMPDFPFDLLSAPPSFHNAAAPVGSGQQMLGFSPSSSTPPFVVSPPGSTYFSVSAPGHSTAVGTRGGAEPTTTELGDVVSAASPAAVDPAGVGFDYSLYQFHADLDDPHLPFPHGHGHPYLGEW